MTICLSKKCGLLLMFCCGMAKHRQGSTISESHEARHGSMRITSLPEIWDKMAVARAHQGHNGSEIV